MRAVCFNTNKPTEAQTHSNHADIGLFKYAYSELIQNKSSLHMNWHSKENGL